MTGKRAKKTAGLMGVVEYAKHRGVSHPTVIEAIKAGRITLTAEKKINPVVADREWMENTDHERAPILSQPVSYMASRAEREQYNAKLAKLDFEEKSGKMVDRQTIVTEYSQLVLAARARFLEIPWKLAPQVAVEDDPVVCQTILDQAISDALEELGNYGRTPEKPTTSAAA